MSEYHKIEILYERDPATFKVNPGVYKNRTYTLLKSWHWTEKIDGTNIRVIWNAVTNVVSFRGRTDNASLHPELLSHLVESFPPAKLCTTFSSSVVLYGEGYGAGIQKGGGLLSPTKRFILFDVRIDDKWWMNPEQLRDIAASLGIDVVPNYGVMTLEDATEFVRVGFKSRLNGGQAEAEGLVGRPEETLFDKKGARLIVKLKTRDF